MKHAMPFAKSADGRRRRNTRRLAIARKAAFLATN